MATFSTACLSQVPAALIYATPESKKADWATLFGLSSLSFLLGYAPIPELTDRKVTRKTERKWAKLWDSKKRTPPRYDEAFKAGAETTLNTDSRLYANKQMKLAQKLDSAYQEHHGMLLCCLFPSDSFI